MKKLLIVLLLVVIAVCGISQTTAVKDQKAAMIWVYTKQGSLQKGVWHSSTDTSLSIYQGSMNEYLNKKSHELASINYENISMIKIKKHGGLLKGLLIGAGIGLAPIVFGQGGAFVAFISFPVGIITGTIVGITSKKKYIINGDLHAFQKFINKRL